MLTNLKLLRMNEKKTQAQYAEKIGMSLTWYSLLENGRYIATDDIKTKLENSFKVKADYLLTEAKMALDELNKRRDN